MISLIPQTGLPRSGSTLLMNVLSQNPKFTIGDDSEIGNLLNHNKHFMIQNIQHFQLPHEVVSDCFYNFCRKGTEAWISRISDPNKIFLDKSRHWLRDLDYFFHIFPDIKIIINIRDLRGIVNSFEKIHNESLFVDKSNLYNQLNFDLQYQRVQNILNLTYLQEGLIALKELIEIPKSFKDKIHICKYESILVNPHNEIKKIYNFLDLEEFEHDFDNIEQKKYYDNPYQPYGIHKISPKIEKRSEDFSHLRPDVSDKIVSEHMWYYQNFYKEVLNEI